MEQLIASMNQSLYTLYMSDENLIFLKPLYFTGGFDSVHKTQVLSLRWLMKAQKLCVSKKKKTWSCLNGRFGSTGRVMLCIWSVDLQEVFSRGT